MNTNSARFILASRKIVPGTMRGQSKAAHHIWRYYRDFGPAAPATLFVASPPPGPPP